MVYRISRAPAADGAPAAGGEPAADGAPEAGGVRLSLTGLPDYTPVENSAARIRAASGEWRLVPSPSGIDVSYELYLDPGRVPRFLANQRLADAVGQTLANLAARFPCAES